MTFEKWADEFEYRNYEAVLYRGMRGFQQTRMYGYGTLTGEVIESRFHADSLIQRIEKCFSDVKDMHAEYISNDYGDSLQEMITTSFIQDKFYFEVTLHLKKSDDDRNLRALRHVRLKFKQDSYKLPLSHQYEKQLSYMLEMNLEFLIENSRNRLDLLTNEYEQDFSEFHSFITK